MRKFILICLGGAAGTGARYLVATGLAGWLGAGFPYGTLAVNVTGSFLLCAIMELGLGFGAVSPELRAVLTTGVMGGYTTYSSFNYELLGYVQRGTWAAGAAYAGLTLAGCFGAGILGVAAARWMAGA